MMPVEANNFQPFLNWWRPCRPGTKRTNTLPSFSLILFLLIHPTLTGFTDDLPLGMVLPNSTQDFAQVDLESLCLSSAMNSCLREDVFQTNLMEREGTLSSPYFDFGGGAMTSFDQTGTGISELQPSRQVGSSAQNPSCLQSYGFDPILQHTQMYDLDPNQLCMQMCPLDQNLPCMQMDDINHNLPSTQMYILPHAQAYTSNQNLPNGQQVFNTDQNLPGTEVYDPSHTAVYNIDQNLPGTQEYNTGQNLPGTQVNDTDQDLPCMQVYNDDQNLSSTQMFCTGQNLPGTQVINTGQNLPSMQVYNDDQNLSGSEMFCTDQNLPGTQVNDLQLTLLREQMYNHEHDLPSSCMYGSDQTMDGAQLFGTEKNRLDMQKLQTEDILGTREWQEAIDQFPNSPGSFCHPLCNDLDSDDLDLGDDLDLSSGLSLDSDFEENSDLQLVDPMMICSPEKNGSGYRSSTEEDVGQPWYTSTPTSNDGLQDVAATEAPACMIFGTKEQRTNEDIRTAPTGPEDRGKEDEDEDGLPNNRAEERGGNGAQQDALASDDTMDAESAELSGKKAVQSKEPTWQRPTSVATLQEEEMAHSNMEETLMNRKEGEPKRPMNGFIRFSLAYRRKIAEVQPKLDNREVSKMCGLEWRRMTHDKRKPYEDEFWMEMEHIRARLPNWNYSPRTPSCKIVDNQLPSRLRPRDKLKTKFLAVAPRKYRRRDRSCRRRDGSGRGGAGQRRLGERQDTWVQCDLCFKWRRLPDSVKTALLSQTWFCSNNPDKEHNFCLAAEEEYREEKDDRSTISAKISLMSGTETHSPSTSQSSGDSTSFEDSQSHIHSFL